MESNSFYNRTSDWQNRSDDRVEGVLFVTDRIGWQAVLLPINLNHYKSEKTNAFFFVNEI